MYWDAVWSAPNHTYCLDILALSRDDYVGLSPVVPPPWLRLKQKTQCCWHTVCHDDNFVFIEVWKKEPDFVLHFLCESLFIKAIISHCSSRWEAHRSAVWWAVSTPEERNEPHHQPLCRRPGHSKIMPLIMSYGGNRWSETWEQTHI